MRKFLESLYDDKVSDNGFRTSVCHSPQTHLSKGRWIFYIEHLYGLKGLCLNLLYEI